MMPNHNPNGEAAAAAGKAVLYTQIVDGGGLVDWSMGG